MTAPTVLLQPTAIQTAAVSQNAATLDQIVLTAGILTLQRIDAFDLQTMAAADMARVLYPMVSFQREQSWAAGARMVTQLAPHARPFIANPALYSRRMLQVALAGILLSQTPTLVRLVARVGRHVAQANRQTVLDHSELDKTCEGWARVSGAGAGCGFCIMLISRGPVYTERSGAFEAHDRCRCLAVPIYDREDWPGMEEFEQADEMYGTASRLARENGTSPLVELRKMMGGH